jgi:hypothetical protein
MLRMSLAACAAALGSLDAMVWGTAPARLVIRLRARGYTEGLPLVAATKLAGILGRTEEGTLTHGVEYAEGLKIGGRGRELRLGDG